MASTIRWTSADLDALPYKEGARYEIIDGELYVSTSPHWHHQFVCLQIATQLDNWNKETRAGQANLAPGVIFSDDNDVIPDLVWISNERLAATLDDSGHLHTAPELIVEVLSPGKVNERRDRELKLSLYSRRGVEEYWIVDWRLRQIEVYRRENLALNLTETLGVGDTLQTPILPGFACPVADLFEQIPK